ncbi:hypothetical protein [Paenibacillus sp. y28]
MKSILMTVLLLLVVIVIYNATMGGSGGTKGLVRERGSTINTTIQSIDP